jgi:hypothetical protein
MESANKDISVFYADQLLEIWKSDTKRNCAVYSVEQSRLNWDFNTVEHRQK